MILHNHNLVLPGTNSYLQWMHTFEEFEDTKGVIRNRISKKNRQNNGQKKKDKQLSTKHAYKAKDRVTRTPLKSGVELGCTGSKGF